ncbi:hypothetical protein [Paenibacillus sp. ACRRY]|uniref:hypothetical protein n=1 Tax=Paenibacillus sp. ACRRY TaxID=2918208 RepID=UPI001EF6A5AB|nr:hypothetical protein [Paenibacillus sp. ACRRY]MCG7381220.1 hypothetical protein [Paenibacillus sp. ACRRY]
MKLRKADEMEQVQTEKSAKNAYIFFTLALLVLSLVNWMATGKTGWEFSILLAGNAVFLWSRVYYKRKTQ